MTEGGGERRGVRRTFAVVAALGVLAACSGGGYGADGPPADPAPTDAQLAAQGGRGTVQDQGASAFAQFMPGLTNEQRRTFAVCNSFFNQNWVTAPA